MKLEKIIELFIGCMLIFISIVFLSIGRDIYGGDAVLLFGMGIVCCFSLENIIRIGLMLGSKELK